MTQLPDYYLMDRRRIKRFLEILALRNNHLNDHLIMLGSVSRFLSLLAPGRNSDAIDLANVLQALLRTYVEFLKPERLQLPMEAVPAMLVNEQYQLFEASDDHTSGAIHEQFDRMLHLYDSLHAARGAFSNTLDGLRRTPLVERSFVSLSQQSAAAAALSVLEVAALMMGSVAHVHLRTTLSRNPEVAEDLVAKCRCQMANHDRRTCAMALHLLAPFVDRIESYGKGFVEAHLSVELERWLGARRARSFTVHASLDEIIHKEYAQLSPYFRINKQVLVNDWNTEGITPVLARRSGVIQRRKERFYVQTKKMDRSIYLDRYRDVFEARNEYLRLPSRPCEHIAAGPLSLLSSAANF